MKYGVYYNHETIGDILLIVFEPNIIPNKVIKHENVVALYNNDSLVGYNFLNISEDIKIKADGYIPLMNDKVIDVLNYILKNHDLKPLDYLNESGFKVAEIKEMEEHPDSDHLHILKVDVGEEKLLNIVCGSYNAKVGLKVVCAKNGTFMPNGQKIVAGEVLGVFSEGMLCSGKELNIKGYENKKGLYILGDEYKVGDDFFKY